MTYATLDSIADLHKDLAQLGVTPDEFLDYYNGTKDLWNTEEHKRISDCYNAINFLYEQISIDTEYDARMPLQHYVKTYRYWKMEGYDE